MGKVEKVIVLSVLFLIALILVVSLTVDAPFDKARVVEAGAPPTPSNTTPIVPASQAEVANLNAQKDATGLLSSQVAPATNPTAVTTIPAAGSPVPPAVVVPPPSTGGDVIAPAAVVVPSALPPGALLKKLDGLSDSILPDMKLYTWEDGDTYRSIAQNYYGNVQKLTVLKRSNEGRNDVQTGQQIFIPVFDSDATASVKAEKSDKIADVKPTTSTGSRIHIVKDGESLWKIAKVELGNGDRWKEIYELNRDVLAKPESVHKGQRLRIP